MPHYPAWATGNPRTSKARSRRPVKPRSRATIDTLRPDDPTGPYSPIELPSEPAPLLPPAAPDQPETWGYLDLLYLLVFGVIALFMLSVIAVGGLYGLGFVFDREINIEEPRIQGPLNVAISMLLWAAVFAFIYLIVAVKYRLRFGPSIGWVRYEGSPVQYLATGPVLAITVVVVSTLLPQVDEKLPLEILLEDPLVMSLLAVFGIFFAPVLEETFFRGFLFPVFERSRGAGFAVFVTSALFSLVHGTQYDWRWQNLLLLLGVGAVFGTLRARTGSILPSTLVHASYNATLFAAFAVAGEPFEKL